jgi:hypothetical protein
MGAPSQRALLIAMAVPDASTWGVINSGDTAPVAAEVSGMLRIAQPPEPLTEALGVNCCWGKRGQQIAYTYGLKSNDLSCYGRKAC